MTYTLDRTIEAVPFDVVVKRTREALAQQGFGILTEIDVKETLKNKLGRDMPQYLILGACNPEMAYQALQIEPRVGAMLPCNVILRTVKPDMVEVSAVDPVASMAGIDNPELKNLAAQVRDLLEKVTANI